MGEQKEKAGRPRVLIRRHIIEIKEDTREWIEGQIDGLKNAFILGKATRSVGEALKGAVSHPVGFLAVTGATTAILLKLGLFKEEIAAIQELILGALSATREAGEDARGALDTAWCRFRVMIARPAIGEEEYENQMKACLGDSNPEKVEKRLQSILERRARAEMTPEQIAAEARERERIQRERAAVPP